MEIQLTPQEFEFVSGDNSSRRSVSHDEYTIEYFDILFKVDKNEYQKFQLKKLLEKKYFSDETHQLIEDIIINKT